MRFSRGVGDVSKKALSVLLAATLCIWAVPAPALAEGAENLGGGLL